MIVTLIPLDITPSNLKHVSSGYGRVGGVQGEWDARLGGNDLRDLELTPDLDERSSGNPRPGSVSFAPGVCSIPMPRGEGAPFNVTRCGEEDMSLTQGALGSSLMMHRV